MPMSTQTLAAESVRQHGFYVPQFEVRIEGVGLPRNVLRDVVQVTYKDNVKEIDSVELTINNWEAATQGASNMSATKRPTTSRALRGTASAIACSIPATNRWRSGWAMPATSG